MSDQKDLDFVDFVVKSIVQYPADIKLERTVDEMGVLITLNLNPEDMGQIIGRKGQTARAIRTLLKIVGAKNNARVNLKIVEPEGSRPRYEDRDSSHESRPSSFEDKAPSTEGIENFTI